MADAKWLSMGDFRLDLGRRELFRGSARIELAPKPFEVLQYLVERPGQVVSKQALLDAVWGGRRADNTVEQAVRQIRRALSDSPVEPRYIRTLSGEGYSFISPVEPEFAPPIGWRWSWRRSWTAGLAGLALLAAVERLRPVMPPPRLANPIRITRSAGRILSPILSDGERLYYQGFDRGVWRVEQVSAAGGESEPVATDLTNAELCDVSPDGSSLLLRSLTRSRDELAPLYIQPLPGGAAQRVGDILAYDASSEPDGRYVLFSGEDAVYRIPVNGGRPEKLFSVPGHAYWLRRSPGRRRLRFTLIDSRTEEVALWEADAGGWNAHRILPDRKDQQCCGSWTPDGSYYVFQVRTQAGYQIWARREKEAWFYAPSEAAEPLTMGPYSYRGPLLGRDGKLYARTEVVRGELLYLDRKKREFVSLLPASSVRTAAFSRDGHWIAYTGLADSNLWRSRDDGAERLQLTTGFLQTAMPAWSPDAQTIAFMGRRSSGDKWSIYLTSAGGGAVRELSLDGLNDAEPTWSADGTRIAYCHWMENAREIGLYIYSLRGGRAAMIPASAGMSEPRWSPDGKTLAAIRLDNGWLELFAFASMRWRPLTNFPSSYPNWSRDGEWVYFAGRRYGRRSVWRVRIADGHTEETESLASVEQGPFFLGDWVGLGPGDTPLVVRNLTTEDIYAWEFQIK
jgi:Tol biopolymer transport system component/DNA-binding winged helix-turn-helix (wHTH) protein